MVYSESLAERVRMVFRHEPGIVEKKMFGGVVYMLAGNLCVGVWQTSLILRLGTEQAVAALKKPFVGRFDVTGRPMKNWVMVAPEGLDTDQELRDWIALAVKFVETLRAK